MRRFHAAALLVPLFVSGLAQKDAGRDSALAYIDTFPRPPRLEGIGNSTLEVSTRSAEAQEYFNQGLSLLHCFWDFEALRAFRHVVRLDPECAMGYWGIYMALGYNRAITRDEMKSAIEKAVELSSGASEQEQHYIRAAAELEKGNRDGYRAEMEALVDRYPDDVEARLFLARHVMAGYRTDGTPRPGQIYSQAILGNLLRTHPDHHAVHHYWIHALETSSRPREALPSAERLTALAPASGHIAHMPGHIYFQLGDYERAHEAFMNSMRVDSEYMERYGIDPVDNWNYFHNVDYLVANCAENGRYSEGLKWAEILQEFQVRNPDSARRSHFVSQRGHVRLMRGRMALPEFYMRYGLWEEAARALERLSRDENLNDPARRFASRLMLYCQALAALQAGRTERAKQLADRLDAELWLATRREARGGRSIAAGALDLLEVASLELRGAIWSVTGRHEAALELLETAVGKREELGEGEPPRYARPVLESLAEARRRAGLWAQAREAYGAVLEKRPNSGHALLGVARTFAEEGRRSEAARAYRQFLEAWRNADRDLPQIREAESWLDAHP